MTRPRVGTRRPMRAHARRWSSRSRPLSSGPAGPAVLSLAALLLGLRVFCRGCGCRSLLQQVHHQLGVLHDLRAVGDLGERLPVERKLLKDLLPQLREPKVLANRQPLNHVARREVLGQPVHRSLGEARQLELLSETEHVLVDLLSSRVVVVPHSAVRLVHVVEHELDCLGVRNVGQPDLRGGPALRRGRRGRVRQALPEDLAFRGEHHSVSGEGLLGAHQ
mmetsp:Transcript_44744/g.127739  ORF Transcript_44744/g.127739 Transcript_44744/m.127739 type:complete len:221 (-) Transcript_44744:213-875(-)